MDLQTLRQQISELDQQLLQTIEKRFAVSQQIAALKKDQTSIYDQTREQELLNEWLKHNLDPNFIRALFHLVLNESRNLMIRNA